MAVLSSSVIVLREYKQLRQEPGPGSRRWFESDGFDLIVWFDPTGRVNGFQICYDFGRGEHALTWRPEIGCTHHAVDSGEGENFSKLTPILVMDGAVPWLELSRTFEQRCTAIDPTLRDLVRTTLKRAKTSGR